MGCRPGPGAMPHPSCARVRRMLHGSAHAHLSLICRGCELATISSTSKGKSTSLVPMAAVGALQRGGQPVGDGEAPRGSGAHCATTAPPASACSSPGLGEGAATDQGEPFERLVITTGGAAGPRPALSGTPSALSETVCGVRGERRERGGG